MIDFDSFLPALTLEPEYSVFAKPSRFAQDLFSSIKEPVNKNDTIPTAWKMGEESDVKRFKFDTPSPDDKVKSAQKKVTVSVSRVPRVKKIR